MASGFSTTWNNFKNLMSLMGKKVSGWWSENKEVAITSAIVGGVVLGGVALALAMPAIIPFATTALGGLAAIPALATGGITNGPTLAMIGDNPGGREVVSPLSDLKGMLIEAVGTAMLSTNQFIESDNKGDVILQVDGSTFARLIGPYTDKEKSRLGIAIE